MQRDHETRKDRKRGKNTKVIAVNRSSGFLCTSRDNYLEVSWSSISRSGKIVLKSSFCRLQCMTAVFSPKLVDVYGVKSKRKRLSVPISKNLVCKDKNVKSLLLSWRVRTWFFCLVNEPLILLINTDVVRWTNLVLITLFVSNLLT